MCMGPKCPCIYPPMPHKEMKYVTFRERSPIDRVLIKNKINEISKTLLNKLKYTTRPPQTLQYQIFALSNLLGEESDSWPKVQSLFSDPSALKNRITELDVNQLTQKQIEKSQYWLEEYQKLKNDTQVVTVFADAARGILSKIIQVEQEKQKELIKDFKDICVQQYEMAEEAAVLSITQEPQECPQKMDLSCDSKTTAEVKKFTFESPQKIPSDRNPNSSSTLFCKFLDRSIQKSPLKMSFCRSPDKSFRDSKRTPNKNSEIQFDDIISLKKELELIQRDITRLEGVNKKKEFLLNRSALRLKTEETQEAKAVEYKKIRQKTQMDESFEENQKKKDLSFSRDYSAFKKELISKRSPTNIQFQQYLEKYTSKYIPILDRITSQQQELRSIKSQLQIASSVRKLKEQN